MGEAVEEDGALGVAGGDEFGIVEAELVVQRRDVDGVELRQRGGVFQVDLGVAAAGLHVADRAVGVQVRAGAGFERLVVVVGIGQVRIARGRTASSDVSAMLRWSDLADGMSLLRASFFKSSLRNFSASAL